MTTKLILSNSRDPSIEPIEVPALADTGSVFFCIPEHVRLPSPNIATGIVKRAA